jgi:hypothetical protein
VVAASACFSALDTTTKFVSATVPLLMALWFRYFFQAIATTAAVLPRAAGSGAPGTARLATGARPAAARQQPAGLLQPALPAGGRVHGHRDDHAAGDHAAGRALLKEHVSRCAGPWWPAASSAR